jgi:hypothetical protein
MLAPRLSLLSVFAGGCLSGAVAVAFVSRSAEVPSARGATPPRLERRPVVEPAPRSVSVEVAPQAPALPTETRHADPADSDGPSVADVLSRLENAYRAQLAAETTSKAPEPVEPPPAAAAEPIPAKPVGAMPAEPVAAPAAVVASKAEPQIEASRPGAPASTPREVPAPTLVHSGNVDRSVQIGTLVQGNVYQLQELAYLQYLQLLTLSSPQTWVVASPQSPSVHARTAPPEQRFRSLTRRKPAFPDSITNPDNPWGFDFPPPMLAK